MSERESMKPYYEHTGITIYHGDCREILPTLAPVDLVLTDPPYGTESLGGGYGRRQLHSEDGRNGRRIAGDEDLTLFMAALPQCLAVLNDACWVATFCAPRRRFEMDVTLKASGLELFGELIWDKGAPGLGYSVRYSHETLRLCRWGSAPNPEPILLSVHREATERGDTRLRHPHKKPLGMMRKVIESLAGGGTTLDPFMGNGTTLRAAKDLGRKAIGIEIEERYCEIAAKRLAQEVFDFEGSRDG